MKKTIYILLGLFILIMSCDNLDISNQQSETFIKIFGSNKADMSNDVKEYGGGFLLLATTVNNNDDFTDIIKMQTDRFGNVDETSIDTLSSKRGGNNVGSEIENRIHVEQAETCLPDMMKLEKLL